MLDAERRVTTIRPNVNPSAPPTDQPPPSRRLWIVISRPDSLVDSLAVAALCRKRFASVHLLFEDSRWWASADWARHRAAFDSVVRFAKVATGRGITDLPRHYKDLVGRQRQAAALGVAPNDVIACLAGILGLANALASAYPKVAKVLIVALKKYEDMSLPADFLRYRHTTSSWFQYHLLEPLAGVNRTLQLKPRRNQGGDGVRLIRLAAPLDEVFQAAVVMSNTGRERPAGAAAQVFESSFPTLRDCLATEPHATSARRRVVFFGTPFKLVENLPASEYAPILNRCLDYLRRHYGARCDLVYRPHPAETDERASLHMDGFAVEDDQEVAQLHFLKHFATIEAVYSVSSTVSRVAYNYGMNAYALYPCFPFPAHSVTYFQTLMDKVPPEFEIRSLDVPPTPYAEGVVAGAGGVLFGDALNAAIDRAESGCASRQSA